MIGLMIGRFQPFHLGHLDAVKFALGKTEKLWLCIGSSTVSHTKNNPFTADERREMIKSSILPDMLSKIQLYDIPDFNNHKKWLDGINNIVPKYDVVFSNDDTTQHICTRHNIQCMPIPFSDRDSLSGTNIRELIAGGQQWESLVPDGTRQVLQRVGAKDRLGSV